MTKKEKIMYQVKVCERAEDMGIAIDSRMNHMIDLSKADEVFDIDYEAWLESDDYNFAHDFIGIYGNIDREAINRTHKCSIENFNEFVPKFAK